MTEKAPRVPPAAQIAFSGTRGPRVLPGVYTIRLTKNGKVMETKLTVGLIVVGGYGFLLMFYYGGAHSVPRRYASYPQEVAQGAAYARLALLFISALLVGVILYLWDTGRRCWRSFSVPS